MRVGNFDCVVVGLIGVAVGLVWFVIVQGILRFPLMSKEAGKGVF